MGPAAGEVGRDLRVAHRQHEGAAEQAGERDTDQGRGGQPAPGPCVEVGTHPDRRSLEHQGEQHEDDDRADVDEQLDQRDDLGPEGEVHAGERAERDDEPQGRVHDVPARHREHAPTRRTSGERRERHARPALTPAAPGRLAGLRRLFRARAPQGRAAGAGGAPPPAGQALLLVQQLADVELGVFELGLQNSASNGQTSTQMPQYMHSEQSIANRSSTLRWRSRPPSTAGSVSLWESM